MSKWATDKQFTTWLGLAPRNDISGGKVLRLDVFSCAVVGWMIAEHEDAALAEALIADTCAQEEIVPQQLTIHADRGSAMTSKAVAHLLADLGVTPPIDRTSPMTIRSPRWSSNR